MLRQPVYPSAYGESIRWATAATVRNLIRKVFLLFYKIKPVMKTLKIFFASFFFILNASAQVNLEHTFTTTSHQALGFQELWLTDMGNSNYKYVIYTYGFTGFGSLDIYNLDYTPYLSNITVPVVCDSTTGLTYHVGYVTTTLFDCDSSNIEFAVMLNTPRINAFPNFAIYRTDGTLIFSKDTVGTIFCVGCGSGSWEMYPIMNTPVGAKLYLFTYVDSLGNWYVDGDLRTYIYGLCGTLPENITEINQSSSFVKVYPNPSSGEISFEVTAPSHMEPYELTILNGAFKPLEKIVKQENTKVAFDGRNLSSGVYFYSLRSGNKVFQTGKFVLTK
jgi:hypothetical protein